MEQKDILTAEISLASIVSFLFVSFCAGFGFVFSLPQTTDNIVLQILLIIIGIFVMLIAVWALNTFIKIYNLKNNIP
ncbi:MAG: hypothetical protein EAZ07_00085 [Cytophagales bacterium]|nr:MAG: hypothetical protein EAZ07_00085 [Cytophagales bacterium]